MKKYLLNLFVLVSQAINVIFLAGHPDQTVSARAFENRYNKVWGVVYTVINKTFYWQSNHCLTSYLEDVARARKMIQKVEGSEGEISG